MLKCNAYLINKIFKCELRQLSFLALNSIRELLSFLSVSSLFIGGTGFFKTYIAYLLLAMKPNLFNCLAVFLVSFSVYTLDKIADMDKDVASMPTRARTMTSSRRVLMLMEVRFIAFDA